MSVAFKERTVFSVQQTPVIEVEVIGKLHTADQDLLIPRIEDAIREHGKVRLLVILTDFQGWSAAALWEDVKFNVKHFNDIERVALVGENKWQQGMAAFCKPFTAAKVCYFEYDQLPTARQWLRSHDE